MLRWMSCEMVWRVDVGGLWSSVGSDEDGWVYTDDSWQNPASQAVTEAEVPSPNTTKDMPQLSLRRVTRRRKWWRRVYLDVDDAP